MIQRASVLLISLVLVVFITFLLTVYIRSMGKYHNAAISDVFNTYAEAAMRGGQMKIIQTLQNAALVDDPNHPDFYSCFQSSWRQNFRRDKTLEPSGQWPDANATPGSATWELPKRNVAYRSEEYRTYGPPDNAWEYKSSDRMSDGMLQILGLKSDTATTASKDLNAILGANAGARWFEVAWLDNKGQPVDEADARYVVRYAVEALDLSGYLGFNFYPELNTDFSSMSNADALALKRQYRALRERYGKLIAEGYAWEHHWLSGRVCYNILPRDNGNARSCEPFINAYRHYLEPYRIEDDPFKVELNWNQPMNAPQTHLPGMNITFPSGQRWMHGYPNNWPGDFHFYTDWRFSYAHHNQIYDLFQGHGHTWTSDGNAKVYKTQVVPGPYYSYQSYASSFLEINDNLFGMFYRPHAYNLFDSGLKVSKGDDCDSPFRVNILTAPRATLENMLKRPMCRLGYTRKQDPTGLDVFGGPGAQLFPFAVGDPLMPFSNDAAAADLYDDNLQFDTFYTFANTANAPLGTTLDTWFERTHSMWLWFYGLAYNEGRQIGPRNHPDESFLSGYNGATPLGRHIAERFQRRNTLDLNLSQTWEHDVMEALCGAILITQRVWNANANRSVSTWSATYTDNTLDLNLEDIKQEWDDYAWLRMGSGSASLADIANDSKHDLATIHDVERLFLRMLGEKINTNHGNARGQGRAYDRQDPSTWRALPKVLSGHYVSYQSGAGVQDDRIREDHVLPYPAANQSFNYHSWPAAQSPQHRLRDHQFTNGMERLLNDVRMSYFGSSAIDFNFDGFAESSVNGWNDGGDNIDTWMVGAAQRGGQKDPQNDRYGPGFRDASGIKTPLSESQATYAKLRDAHVDWMELDNGLDNSRDYGFTVAGRLYMGKSQAYRIFIRGQVWDLVRNKKTSEVNLDMVYAPNPSDDPTSYAIEDTDLSDSHIISQRPIRNYRLIYSEDAFTE